jgi:hypothetical protein
MLYLLDHSISVLNHKKYISYRHINDIYLIYIFHDRNPVLGTIINQPDGPDVYQGVPKDYTGLDVSTGIFSFRLECRVE